MDTKFEVKSARVKGLCFHPTKPWVITSLHSGLVQIWDYNMKILIAKFDEHGCPVRGVDFHPHLPLFVTGSDDGDVRVWNYKQKRCTFVLKGHIDYLRTTYFHHELPWILSASDDQTMRIWNYQNRNCVNIITGHCHYVMCAQFHHQKNLIVSASLDSTIRIWDYSILRKKLTQTKNASAFIGIEIQCIKILEGHQRGANWVAFHPSNNLIASGSDDRKIKLWKYTNQVAWEHSTILGHRSNVSCVMFDKVTGNLISNSQDKTAKIWNIDTKTQIATTKQQKARYWIFASNKSGSLLAAGHDQGFDIHQIHKDVIPYCLLDANLLLYSQGMHSYLYDIATKKQKIQLYQYVPKDKSAVFFIDKLITNRFEPKLFMVQINVAGKFNYLVKKKQQYLTYPTIASDYQALDSCFISKDRIAQLHSNKQLRFGRIGAGQKFQVIALKQPFCIKSIFPSNVPDQLFLITQNNNKINIFNTQKKAFKGQQLLEDIDVQSIECSFGKIAVMSRTQILITTSDLRRITLIRENYVIQSIFWEAQNLLFYTTTNHFKYALMNGQTGVIKTLEEPLRLIKKLPNNKFLVFNEKQKIQEIQFPQYHDIEFKIAMSNKQWDKVKEIIKNVGTETDRKILIKYLIDKGHADLALDMVQDIDQKFALAIQASNFELAYDLCSKKNTVETWRMLGEQALKQGIFQAYQLACQKLKNFDQLNFLYSLQNNTQKLQKMLRISKKMNNSVLAFNTSIFLNNSQSHQTVLRDVGLDSLAQLCVEARKKPDQQCDLLRRLGSRPLQVCEVVGDDNFSNWPHNIDDDDDEQDEEQDDQ